MTTPDSTERSDSAVGGWPFDTSEIEGKLEGYTPPECEQDRDCVAALQTIRNLRILLASRADPSAWLPISSAPMDGTEIDLFGFPLETSTKPVRIIDCHFHCGEWLAWRDWEDLEWSWVSIHQPTHWRPIVDPTPQNHLQHKG